MNTEFYTQKIGRINLLGVAPKKVKQRLGTNFLAVCDCGNFLEARQGDLKKGKKSCGCFSGGEARTSHGATSNLNPNKEMRRVYNVYKQMKRRCFLKTSKDYPRYGGRGITTSNDWVNSFETFLRDMGIPEKGLQLDRIDSNGNYCKENCRWATPKQQSNNRECVKKVFFSRRTEKHIRHSTVAGHEAEHSS